MKFLAETVDAILNEAVERAGLVLPVYLVSVSANGQILAVRFDELGGGVKAKVLCEHMDEGFFRVPIHLYFSDGSGKAVHALIGAENGPHEWAN